MNEHIRAINLNGNHTDVCIYRLLTYEKVSTVKQWGVNFAGTIGYQFYKKEKLFLYIHKKNKFLVDFRSKGEQQIVTNILEYTLR